MGKAAAKQGDRVIGLDTHVVMVPSAGGPIPTPTPMSFSGELGEDLSGTVFIDDEAAATKGSRARNQPPHVATNGTFQKAPADVGTVDEGSASIFFDDKAAARAGDRVKTCNDPSDAPNGVVVAAGTVILDD